MPQTRVFLILIFNSLSEKNSISRLEEKSMKYALNLSFPQFRDVTIPRILTERVQTVRILCIVRLLDRVQILVSGISRGIPKDPWGGTVSVFHRADI